MKDDNYEFFEKPYSSEKNTKCHVHDTTGISSKSIILFPNPNRPLFALNVASIKKWLSNDDSAPHGSKKEKYLNGNNIED